MSIGRFTNGSGQTVQGQEAVIPICTFDDHNGLICIGTGFFISVYGVFATAAHVVEHILDPDGNPPVDKDGNSLAGLCTFHFIPPNQFIPREINYVVYSKRDDVAVGTVNNFLDQNTGKPFRNKVMTLTTRVPEVGSNIASWAYPNSEATFDGKKGSLSIWPKVYEGKIEDEHREGRGGILPGRCYQTNLGFEGGASGGPVFEENGQVFAVNSSAFDGIAKDLAYVSHIQPIGGLKLARVQIKDGVEKENIAIHELISQGFVKVD